MDFKELSKDADIVKRITNFDNAINKIDEVLQFVEDTEMYDTLSNKDKIQYNLLLSYSLNALFWMYLKLEGIDVSKHKIKNENERLKKSMFRAKQLHDRHSMPRLDKEAAARFVKHGLWTPVPRAEESVTNCSENWDDSNEQ